MWNELLVTLLGNNPYFMLNSIGIALWETFFMVSLSSLLAFSLGIPLGIILFTTRRQQILANQPCNIVLGTIVNIVRSIPFIILLIALIPLTQWLLGTSIGKEASVISLSIAAMPFVGRLVENVLSEVSYGLIEAGQAMGATPYQIISKILLPEALPGIINALTITAITLVGYSAMAGAVGGGGLGDLALRHGYYRFNPGVMLVTITLLVILVQGLQSIGDFFAKKLRRD